MSSKGPVALYDKFPVFHFDKEQQLVGYRIIKESAGSFREKIRRIPNVNNSSKTNSVYNGKEIFNTLIDPITIFHKKYVSNLKAVKK